MKAILADDHEILRAGVRQILMMVPGDHQIVEATNYEEVLTLAAEHPSPAKPDIVFLDLEMPGLPCRDWMHGVRRVCEAFNPTPVVVLSGTEEATTVAGALKAGACGFLPKTTPAKTFIAAINFVLAGEIYVPPALLGAVSPSLPAPAPGDRAPGALSDKELAALTRLVAGMTNKEIARELGIQEITVKVWLRNAYRKIGASNRIDAVRIACDRGLVHKAP